MRSITPILNTKGLSSLNDCAKVKLLLYGDDSLSRDVNSIILKATLQFFATIPNVFMNKCHPS